MDAWAARYPIVRVRKCEKCNGTTALVNEFGMIKMCDDCGSSAHRFMNQYGTHNTDAPSFYVDEEAQVVAAVDRSKDYIILPHGEAIERLII